MRFVRFVHFVLSERLGSINPNKEFCYGEYECGGRHGSALGVAADWFFCSLISKEGVMSEYDKLLAEVRGLRAAVERLEARIDRLEALVGVDVEPGEEPGEGPESIGSVSNVPDTDFGPSD